MNALKTQQETIRIERANLQQHIRQLLAAKAKNRDLDKGGRQSGDMIRQQQKLEESYTNIGSVKDKLYQATTPQELTGSLDDSNPCLLLPVRLETKFRQIDGKLFLCIRVYPDDIAINTHEASLTNEEYAAGKQYWTSLFGAADATAKRTAWNTVNAVAGSNRAAWIINQCRPGNWEEPPASADLLDFPPHQAKDASWTQPPRLMAMPDKFVFTGYNDDDTVAFEKTGETIPDDLQVAFDPLAATPQISKKTGTKELDIDEKLSWMFDFTTAEKKGMAIRIALDDDQARKGFKRILVLGLRLSSGATETVSLIEELIDNHHYAKSGFRFLPQGTPTNNTEEEASGYSSDDAGSTDAYQTEANEALYATSEDPLEKKDGQYFAEALRIGNDKLYHIANSDRSDMAEALLMNKTLWPGTLGYYLNEMMFPVFSEQQSLLTRSFFNEHVSGRGPVPAFCINRQPYGVLLSSCFHSWKWHQGETGKNSSFYNGLYDILSGMEDTWQELTATTAHTGSSGTPFSLLLSILGSQPGAVEFHQRVGVDAYLNYNTMAIQSKAVADKWENSFTRDRNGVLTALGMDISEPPKIADIAFYGHTNLLTGALVDDENPLSETDSITTYDGSNNYIGWLLSADSAALEEEVFTDADGNIIDAPKALLYLALRNAYLQQIWYDTNDLYKTQGLIGSAAKEISILNVVDNQTLTRMDYLKADVHAMLGPEISGGASINAIDFAIGKTSLLFNSYLYEMKAALTRLKDIPTARLERLFTEHLDLCSYRLDAWQTGMFRKRLEYLRTTSTAAQTDGEQGLYVGAYGWLEDIRPKTARKEANMADIPEKLRETARGKIWETDARGGYVHGRSLNHAITGAVLRSAYLSHADDAYTEQLSVNLSSQRVRKALYYLDGIRNGQTMASLMGYAFERWLHDNDEGLEMDQYIYPFREKYPLVVSEIDLPEDAGTALSSNMVTDGNKLLDAYTAGSYPFGVTGLPAATSAEGKCIMAAIDDIADAMDAISDLALGESMYQLVQGNYERGGAVLKAYSEARNPPLPQIVDTPRKGELITNRIFLQLDNAAMADPWGVGSSAAGTMEKGLNNWLSAMLPEPANIRCLATCTYTGDETSVTEPFEISLKQLNIEPIDFVLQMDKSFGKGASGIEQRIALYCRENLSDSTVTDEGTVEILFRERSSDWTEEVVGFFSIVPLVKNLRDIITGSRHLHAMDFRLPSDAQLTTGENPKGYDTSEISNGTTGRLDSLYNALQELHTNTFTGLSAIITDPGEEGTADLGPWREALKGLLPYGFTEAIPASVRGGSKKKYDALKTQVEAVTALLGDRLLQAKALIDTVPEASVADDASDADKYRDTMRINDAYISNYTAAAKLLLGSAFPLVPVFSLENAADIQQGIDNSANLLRYASTQTPFITEEWLQGLGKVRPNTGKLDQALMYAQNLSLTTAPITAFQLPFDAADHWVCVEFPAEMKIDKDYLAIGSMLPAGYTASGTQSGLLIDDWSELVPKKSETTGIAFHYDQPGARPPQVVLLAVTPEITGNWSWSDLMDTLNDTLDRAKRRAVEPDQVDGSAYAQFLPGIMTAFSNSPVTLSTYWARNITGMIQTQKSQAIIIDKTMLQ